MTIAKEIMSAIKDGDSKKVKSIFTRNPDMLYAETPLGTWLHIATRKGQKKIVEVLVALGIDVNAEGGVAKATPLNAAASEGNVELVVYLLDRGATLDVSEPEKNPLFSAIHNGHEDIVNLLLEAGIDTKIAYTGSSMKNMDAIAFAKEWGRTEIVELIEQYNKKQ